MKNVQSPDEYTQLLGTETESKELSKLHVFYHWLGFGYDNFAEDGVKGELVFPKYVFFISDKPFQSDAISNGKSGFEANDERIQKVEFVFYEDSESTFTIAGESYQLLVFGSEEAKSTDNANDNKKVPILVKIRKK